MINLIPPQAKKALLIEYWIRVVSFWFVLWSVALLIGAVLLTPVQVLISSQTEVYAESAEVATQDVLTFESVSYQLVQSSQQARFIVDEKEVDPLSQYIELFQNLEGTEVSINNINLVRNQNGFNPVSISGIADNRLALGAFQDRLLQQPEVLSVDLPISNLAQDVNISFNIDVTLNPSEL